MIMGSPVNKFGVEPVIISILSGSRINMGFRDRWDIYVVPHYVGTWNFANAKFPPHMFSEILK